MTARARIVLRWLGAGLTTMAGAALIARQSAVALPTGDARAAHLRLSWMARPERIESCRALSEKELEEREEHMRQRVECEGRSATYRLLVTVDSVVAANTVLRGGGLRNDRPIHLLREFAVPDGIRRLRVSVTRIERDSTNGDAGIARSSADRDTGLFAGRAERESVERSRRARAAMPARLTLDTTVALRAGLVTLVTFDAEQRVLRLVQAP